MPSPTRPELIEAALRELLAMKDCEARRDTFPPGSSHWLALNGEYEARKEVSWGKAQTVLTIKSGSNDSLPTAPPSAVGAPVVDREAYVAHLKSYYGMRGDPEEIHDYKAPGYFRFSNLDIQRGWEHYRAALVHARAQAVNLLRGEMIERNEWTSHDMAGIADRIEGMGDGN